ncbi:hypothetical protein [Paenibacillus mesotrionivorans]|uniref:Uncharacterized protein n=1 Tax=Paenibacillus mesotrionivorans TaxID=3160968 RepID=A0ACC7P9H8_9BACL
MGMGVKGAGVGKGNGITEVNFRYWLAAAVQEAIAERVFRYPASTPSQYGQAAGLAENGFR